MPPCPWCSHSMLDFMQPSGEQDKETPDKTIKFHKALKLLLLGCCTFPGTVMGEDEFIKLQVWENVTCCLHLASNRWHRHACSVHYLHHQPGTMSKELFMKTGKEAIYPFPRLIAVLGIYATQLNLKQSLVGRSLSSLLTKQGHAGLELWGT